MPRTMPQRATVRAAPPFFLSAPAGGHGAAAPYAVLPVPYEGSVSFGRGTGRAPRAILAASREIELFDEELRRPPRLRVQTLPAVDCRRGADVLAAIGAAARPVLARRRFLLALGGEHTITAPLVAAARGVWPALSVLHLDAHLDLRDRFRGRRWSHACVMRRVRELGLPIVHVGIRSLCAEEDRLVGARAPNVFWARAIAGGHCRWMAQVIARLTHHVYVSLDVDALDPAVMPGTGTPEPGGLSWREVTGLLRRVCAARQVVAADLVETVPLPGAPLCEYTAARLAAKLLTYHAANAS